MKLKFFNDTGRVVSVHPATVHKVACFMNSIKPLETREFHIPDGKDPYMKLWDYGDEKGLQIFVSYDE